MKKTFGNNNDNTNEITIRSVKIQDYLGERGIFPKYYEGTNATYKRTPMVLQLLEDYEIYKAFRNFRIGDY